jgi:hypothetical protein
MDYYYSWWKSLWESNAVPSREESTSSSQKETISSHVMMSSLLEGDESRRAKLLAGPSTPAMLFDDNYHAAIPLPTPNAPSLSLEDCLESGDQCFQNLVLGGFSASDLLRAEVSLKKLLDCQFSVSCFHHLGFLFGELMKMGLNKQLLLTHFQLRIFNSWVMFYGKDYRFLLELKLNLSDLMKCQLSLLDYAALKLTVPVLIDDFKLDRTSFMHMLPFTYTQLKDYHLLEPNGEQRVGELKLTLDDWCVLVSTREWPLRVLFKIQKQLPCQILQQQRPNRATLGKMQIKSMQELLQLEITTKAFLSLQVNLEEWIKHFQLQPDMVDRLGLSAEEWEVLKAEKGWSVQTMNVYWDHLPSIVYARIRFMGK